MHVYDVTLKISPDLPVWPGDPGIQMERVEKIEEGGTSNVTRITMSAHTGTHVDAPYHFLPDGSKIDEVSLKALTGRAYVLHLPNADKITADILEAASIPPRTRRVLFRTRNSELWARGDNEFHRDFVAVTADGAGYLVDKGVKLVGIDYLSVAPFQAVKPTHEILLKAGVVVVEGLDLSLVSQGRYTFYCLPLNLAGAEAAPARAILVGV